MVGACRKPRRGAGLRTCAWPTRSIRFVLRCPLRRRLSLAFPRSFRLLPPASISSFPSPPLHHRQFLQIPSLYPPRILASCASTLLISFLIYLVFLATFILCPFSSALATFRLTFPPIRVFTSFICQPFVDHFYPESTPSTSTTTISNSWNSSGLVATPSVSQGNIWIPDPSPEPTFARVAAFDNNAHDPYPSRVNKKVIADEGATAWDSDLVDTAEVSAHSDMLRLLSWGSTIGGDKALDQEWTFCHARQPTLPSKEYAAVSISKRKRPDMDLTLTTPVSNKKHKPTSNNPPVVKTESQTGLAPSQTSMESQEQVKPLTANILPHPVPKTDAKAEVGEPSSVAVGLSESQLRSLRSTIDAQIGLEVLLKHKELRLIDQELAKCQIALEQLRRCSEIPYPVSRLSEEVSSGTGSSVRRPGLRSLPESPAPWGVVDGPYTRHYAKWLLPDKRFDGSETEEFSQSLHGKSPAKGRSTRGNLLEPMQMSGKGRTHQGGKTPGPRGSQAPPQDKSGPMILKRKSDGAMVKLVCIDCGRHNFGSPQGFINHCRIGHGRSFTSHDAAAEACGEPVEFDASGAVVGHEPASTPTTSLVHPLIRSARMLQQPATPTPSTSTTTPTDVEMTDARSEKQSSAKDKRLASKPSPDFMPSLSTPNLSALIQNRGLGLNLESIVADARTKIVLPEQDSDEDEMEVDTPLEEVVGGRHPQVAGNKHPARSNISPLPSPTLSRVPMASPQLQAHTRSPFINTDFSKYTSSPAESTFSNHRYPMSAGGLEPSPTNESHQAPSLVDDDGEEAHSPSNSISFGDEAEAESVDFEVEDDERVSQSAGSGPGLHHDFRDRTESCEAPSSVGRPASAIRHSLGGRDEKHVTFVSPSPARELAKKRGGSWEKKRKRN